MGGMRVGGNTLLKLVFVIAILFLAIDIGGRLVLSTPEVKATAKVQYKVISAKPIKTCAEYEDLLNGMASQGWVFDHFIEAADIAVFKK
jgi:hypothetical protein